MSFQSFGVERRNTVSPSSRHPLSRRTFLLGAAAASATVSLAQFPAPAWAMVPQDEFMTWSTTQVAALIREKKLTAMEAVNLCYARIDAVNPKLNAVVAMCRERALAEAREADAMLAAGKIMGPLHGVPFTVKDSFDTAGVVSTGGTMGRKSYVPGKDATVVARVRAAGAILLGKTNTPEFTLGGGARGTYNLIHGQTYNPYNTAYSPAGSSGGAGSIVAAGGAFFDIGSDYGGSIRGPANVNGIAGIKPTYGLVPRTGHIVDYGGPFDNFQETGPLARRVQDLVLLLPLLAGPDGADAAMAPVPVGDVTKVDLRKLRVAYYLSDGLVDPTAEIQAMVKECSGMFKDLGCKVTQDMPPKMKELAEARRKFNGAPDGDHLRRMLAKYGTLQASPGLRLSGELVPSSEFTRLCEVMDAIKSEQLAWLEKYDLILCPANAKPPQKVPSEFVRPLDVPTGSYTSQYNTTGWPAGVVRAGISREEPGMPLGIQVVGQPWRDDVVLAAMAHIEKLSGGWQRPTI